MEAIRDRPIAFMFRGHTGLVTCCLPWCVKLPGGHLTSIKSYKKHINM